MKTPSATYGLGTTVYRQVAPSIAGMVTGILYRPGVILFLVTWSDDYDERTHYGCELTNERGFDTGVETDS